MKQAITSLAILAIAITPNLANANQAENQKKIAVVKKVISNLDKRMNTVLANATPELKKVSQQAAKTSARYTHVSCAAWDIIGGQDYDSQKLVTQSAKYTVLKNGEVKVTFRTFYDSPEVNTVIFEFKKSGKRYLISDFYDSDTSFIGETKTCLKRDYGIAL